MLDELSHLISFVEIIASEKIQSFDDLIRSVVDHLDNVLDVNFTETSVLGKIFVGVDGLCIDDLFAIDGDDLIPQNCSYNIRQLKKKTRISIKKII